MEYEIVDRQPELERPSPKSGRWVNILKPLPFEKAIKFVRPDKKSVQRLGALLLQTFRQDRHCAFRIHYRSFSENGQFAVYVWKEPKEK